MVTMRHYKDFNVRQLQAYAALCLWEFCSHLGIKHSSIDELIHHLLAILTASSLPDWEQSGAVTAITGRGDPLPENVTKVLAPDSLGSFKSLVENCVEVGIVDMYGASTDQPLKYLENCVRILKDSGVELPSPEILSKHRKDSGVWGEAITDAEFRDILIAYGVDPAMS